jgi:N-acetylmuramoyl-L-alanine amidase
MSATLLDCQRARLVLRAAPVLVIVLLCVAAAGPLHAGDASPATASLKQVRVGVHAGFTRLVMDLTDAAEWSADLDPRGCIRVLIPGARLLPSAEALEISRGIVRSVRPLQHPSGIEISVACRATGVEFRMLTLEEPARIVLDVSASEGGREAGKARTKLPAAKAEGRDAPPPAASAAAKAPAAVRDTPAVALPPGGLRPAKADPGRSVPGPAAAPAERPLTIVLDPGHGGHDTGAIGPNGLLEKDVVLDLARRLAGLLRDRLGVRALLTRTEDVFVPLPDRTAFANAAKADFLISLHVNGAGKRGAEGFETFFFSREPSDSDARASAQRENLPLESSGPGSSQDALLRATLADMAVTRDMKESSTLAEEVLAALDALLPVQNRGVRSGPFYVLATAAMPAVLVESAFITNPGEERKLRTEAYRSRLTEALYDGIARYKTRYERRLGRLATPPGTGS